MEEEMCNRISSNLLGANPAELLEALHTIVEKALLLSITISVHKRLYNVLAPKINAPYVPNDKTLELTDAFPLNRKGLVMFVVRRGLFQYSDLEGGNLDPNAGKWCAPALVRVGVDGGAEEGNNADTQVRGLDDRAKEENNTSTQVRGVKDQAKEENKADTRVRGNDGVLGDSRTVAEPRLSVSWAVPIKPSSRDDCDIGVTLNYP
ncbi:hypothetical protein BU23DRAFT_238889 [Bimuria novae-zelandiae CBS 107.79]|uniref:Uncharacterized protein n=1 Tax=Bimuria novae-zelandiae CBS 107.79 TaxID=1447943 RepID=A0A6A5UWM9_9PLEO|nr:hypothetical protein BU23DRAFT_238889 [Bimuria novae-zelandiae CBS 107.79]